MFAIQLKMRYDGCMSDELEEYKGFLQKRDFVDGEMQRKKLQKVARELLAELLLYQFRVKLRMVPSTQQTPLVSSFFMEDEYGY